MNNATTSTPRRTVIPFGPQHPVLPEPLHLRLVLEDEKVVEAQPAVGYIHRGIEKLAEVKDFQQNVFLLEHVCGICSFIHALAYCQGIEELMGVEVPARARYLRVVWSELNRLHSHLLWLGLLADAFGFESLFMQIWRARERVLDLEEQTAGARIMLSTCTIGGVRRDLSAEQVGQVLRGLDELEREFDMFVPVVIKDATVKERLCGVGVLTQRQAQELGAVGPVARASGIARDLRVTGYAAYGELGVNPVIETDGDCYARTLVRVRELYQSLLLLRKALRHMPDSPIAVAVKGKPEGEVVMRVEQPRGEVMYYLKANGTATLERVRVRTPTFANLPALLAILPGCELADVPVITLSIDPCVSCTER
ncbi:MAG: nickel-dependent hydrogenase large subunit [bacterium]|nr:nickel-dependent hydrogenase large subunit [bacterium]